MTEILGKNKASKCLCSGARAWSVDSVSQHAEQPWRVLLLQEHGDSWWQTQQDQSDLGEGDPSPRQQRDGPGQVQQQPAGQGHRAPHQSGEWVFLLCTRARYMNTCGWAFGGLLPCSRARRRCSEAALETPKLPVHSRHLLPWRHDSDAQFVVV